MFDSTWHQKVAKIVADFYKNFTSRCYVFVYFKVFECCCFSVSVVFVLAGRQVKMAYVNSVAKPPRDVRRRQEKFGTTSGSSAASTVAAAPIKSVFSRSFSASILIPKLI